jgi:hypothetical protein
MGFSLASCVRMRCKTRSLISFWIRFPRSTTLDGSSAWQLDRDALCHPFRGARGCPHVYVVVVFCPSPEGRKVLPGRMQRRGRGELTPRNLNALSSEEARIDRPCAGPEHCQCSAQCGQEDVYPRIVGMQESETHLRDGHRDARDRCTETDQQQSRGACRRQLGCHRWRSRNDSRDAVVNRRNHRYQSQEEKSGSGPTVRKS